MKFADLRLAEPILRSLVSEGYEIATPIQAEAIPHVLAGSDVLGVAQTGTGKTAAFALPILQRLSAKPSAGKCRCLVLCPTRELATQIGESFSTYGKHLRISNAVVFGGVNQNPQAQALRRGTDVIIATPGRLLDLMNQGLADLRGIEVLVLDEADRMLDMGFINDIRKIVAKLSTQRQTLLFSATMPAEIRDLANTILRKPVTVQMAKVAQTAAGIDESVYFVDRQNKPTLLAHLVGELPMTRAIVFTRTKHGADRVVRQLNARGIKAEAIHGNKSQNHRQRSLSNFRANKIPVLVATDIASRGIDIDGITHVVNFDLTHEPETYVHRIGRTARAGALGAAVSFCDREEIPNLKAIERLIRRPIPVRNDHPEYAKGGGLAGSAAIAADAPESHDRPARRSQAQARPHRQGGGQGGAPARHHAAPASHHGPVGRKPAGGGSHRSGPARRPASAGPAPRPGKSQPGRGIRRFAY